MPHVVTALFLVAAVINLLPLAGILGARQLEALYGMPFSGSDLVLLMRHRAALFGIVGSLLAIAAFRPRLRAVAGAIGLASMLSFLLLSLPLAEHGVALQRVFWVDAIGTMSLVLGLVLSRRSA